ncbi:MAG: hypothetical protein HY897_15460 [Deltaproteobacteria bacterium]|nr:hypothetical protein [Deltaproteobacteria bacterium]
MIDEGDERFVSYSLVRLAEQCDVAAAESYVQLGERLKTENATKGYLDLLNCYAGRAVKQTIKAKLAEAASRYLDHSNGDIVNKAKAIVEKTK